MQLLLMAAAKNTQLRIAGSELIGQLAGEYRILRKIGAGAFGTVYEAEHPLLKRRAAVKVLHVNPSVNSVAVQRFIEEARSASQIRHRHIVDIFSFGTLPTGQYFYVMDFLDGAPLDRYLREHGRLAPELALPVLRPIASAIDALHAASLVHRDLKPANIYLAWDSNHEVVPKLLDFGLVKLLGTTSVHTQTGVPLGTPFYMSPEQCQGEKVDSRADIYSFGVICYEVLTGTIPFRGESATAVLLAHLTQEPLRPSEARPEISAELDEPVLRMLAKDPNARPSSAAEAIRALTLAAHGAGVTIGDSAPWLPRLPAKQDEPQELGVQATIEQSGTRDGDRGANPPRRAKLWWSALALTIFLAVGAALLSRTPESQPEPAPQPQPGTVVVPDTRSPEPNRSYAPAPPPSVEVHVKGAPPGAEIQLGDQKLGEAPGPIWVPYGEEPVDLTVIVPGRGPRTLSLTPNAPAELTLPADKPRPAKRSSLPRDLENPF